MAWRGHLSRNLKELRIHFCQTSPASAQTREFVLRNYKDLKTLNPMFPILIRECSGVEPLLWARYATGVVSGDQRLPVAGISARGSCSKSEFYPDYLRYLNSDMGLERCVRLEGLTEVQIAKKLEELVKLGAAPFA